MINLLLCLISEKMSVYLKINFDYNLNSKRMFRLFYLRYEFAYYLTITNFNTHKKIKKYKFLTDACNTLNKNGKIQCTLFVPHKQKEN